MSDEEDQVQSGPIGGARRRYPDGAEKVAEDKKRGPELPKNLTFLAGRDVPPYNPAPGAVNYMPEHYVGHFTVAPGVTLVQVKPVANGYIVSIDGEDLIASTPEIVGKLVTGKVQDAAGKTGQQATEAE